MKIPEWLAKRSTQKEVPFEIVCFAKAGKANVFGEITVDLLKKYYQEKSGKEFFKLIRLLGFYGVIFYKKLSVYSGPIEDKPKVIFIPEEYRDKKLSAYKTFSNMKSLLNSCGVFSLKNLHGVPIKNFNKLIVNSPLNSEGALFPPLKVVTIDECFFYEFIESKSKKNDEQHFPVFDSEFSKTNVDEKFSKYESDVFATHTISSLDFSIRVRNCFEQENILSLKVLINRTEYDLLSFPHFGKKSLDEIKSKLSSIGLCLSGNSSKSTNKPVLDLNSKEMLSTLNTKIKDISLSIRTRNCLRNKKIDYMWQLVEVTESELLKAKNLGRKSFNELKKLISDLSIDFGHHFSFEEIKKITSYEYEVDRDFINSWLKLVSKKLISDPLDFLTDKERVIVQKRVFEVKFKKSTLEEIAQIYGITRERIRQLERNALKKIKQKFRPEIREVTKSLIKQLEVLGGIDNFKDIEVDLSFLTSKEQIIVDQLVGLETNKIHIDWSFLLVSSRGPCFTEKVCKEIRNEIYREHNDELFKISQFANAVEKVSTEQLIFNNRQYENLSKKFLKKYKVTREGKYLSIGKIKKIEKLAIVFKDLFPKGLKIYQKQDDLLTQIKKRDPVVFNSATHRSVIAHITAHHNVLLWDRGFFIHNDNVSYDVNIIKEIIAWILSHFDKGYYRFQIGIPYLKFKEELNSSGIPNQYALYTLIRRQEVGRIGQRKYPTIVDLEANVNPEEGILEELEAFFKDQKGEVTLKELRKEFVVNKGWKESSVQQNLCSHSELIFPWRKQTYIHIDHLNLNNSKLQELISALRVKLKEIDGAYNLKGAKTEMSLLWEQTCPSATTRTISKLIRLADPDDLIIERNFIRLGDSSPESVSTVGALENFFLEKNEEINRHVLNEEFLKNRGWTEAQMYGAIRKAHLFQSGDNTYIHPTTINWNENLSQIVHEVLSDYLKERNANKQPHMQIEALIYEYVLPELSNGIEWTRQLLNSLGKEFEDFLFFDDAYIFIDNDFDIEDFDDMIGFLIGKTFKLGIAQRKEVERLMWREGIILNGRKIPQDQYFKDSSIYYSKSSDEIGLSSIGIERYGNRG